MTFNDRDSYLKFRSEWKKHYNEISDSIRTLRAQSKLGSDAERSASDSRRHFYSKMANSEMIRLTEAKEEARRQYEKRKKERVGVE